jgi:GT2 family glycosyltransferase
MRASPVAAGHHAGAVVAVVVTQGATDFLAGTLEALAAQDDAPDQIVVVDVGRDTDAVQDAVGLAWPGGARPLVVAFPGARTFGHAVRAALATLAESDPAGAHRARDGWLWLLHDDSAPRHGALGALLRAVELAPSVAVAGCKQVDWEEPARLVEVGVSTSRYGRRMTDLDDDEVDQGQHDGQEDVLAVGLAGALVRRDVWDLLRGPDPALGPYGDGLDLCRRARLAGHRVVVVPQAAVRHAQASLRGHKVRRGWDERRSVRARREAFLHGQLVGVPLPLVGVVALLAIGASVVRAGMRLVVKEPHLVLAELVAPWAVLGRPSRLVAARRSTARTSVVRRATLRPLQRSTRDVLRQLRDRRLAAAESRRTRGAPSELEQRELATLRSRRRAGLAVVVVVSVVLTFAALGTWLSGVLAGARLTGGTLTYGDAGLAQLWADAGSWWVRTGLGHAAPPDPLLAALLPGTAVLGSVGSAAAALVFCALLLAGLGAWFAAGAATRSVALRLWAALTWVATPALLLDLQQVRLGALLTHVSLPWALLGVARALGVARVEAVQSGLVGAQHVTTEPSEPESTSDEPDPSEASDPAEVAEAADASESPDPPDASDRPVPSADAGPAVAARVPSDPPPETLGGLRQTAEPSFAAAAGAGLALCLVTAGTPALLAAVVVGLVLVAALRPRRRLWWVALPPLVLQGPTIAAVVADPGRWRALLAAPGVPVASTAAPAWQQLLGWPSVPADVLARLGTLPTAVLWIPGAVLAVLALLALAVRPPAVRVVRLGWVLAALGAATGLAVGHIRVAVVDGQVTAGWPGGATSLVTAGLVAGALVGAGRVRARLSSAAFGVRHMAAGALAVVAVAAPLALLTGWVAQVHQVPPPT